MAPWLRETGSKWAYQEEVSETGTPHIQGFVRFKTKKRFTQLTKWNPKLHWEKARGSEAEASQYCMKDDETRKKDGIREYQGYYPSEEIKVRIPSAEWEIELEEELLKEPDDRKMIWIWSKAGNTGKSSFCKYMVVRHDALVLGGKGADMKYMVHSWIEKKGYSPRIILLDVPRLNLNWISYPGMEEVKNGCFASTKFECGMVVMNSPHMVVFANEPPRADAMSEDRWDIREIF